MIFVIFLKLWINILIKLDADWTAPANVKAFTTLRQPGFSHEPYAANNLALHVGDNPHYVNLNRARLKECFRMEEEPAWLEQIHSNICVVAEEDSNRVADAIISRKPSQPLAILTADCLPILMSNRKGTEVAAIHAGWRGLAKGIIENTLDKLLSPPKELIAWVGPAICQSCFEVGEDVLESYQRHYPFCSNQFYPKGEKWQANLPGLAEQILRNLGVSAVFQSNACTFEQKKDFFSYRREPQTGRMATVIWFT
ncbi:peptidoglycan editing factor PgeF [Legionella jordanis]|nr:peptidoglycan editing factor PgeF [Legionella jordanis]RMX21139.1 peptidoglycan editing factor PgeF [Legionella jordanis]